MLAVDKLITGGLKMHQGSPVLSTAQLEDIESADVRLWDLVGEDLTELIMNQVGKYGPIKVDNIMSQYWDNDPMTSMAELPPMISPFPWTWVEGSMSPSWQKNLDPTYSKRRRWRWAMLYQTVPLKNGVVEVNDEKLYVSDAPFKHWQNLMIYLDGEATEASYLATAIILMDRGKADKQVVGPLSAMHFFLDKQGHFMVEETERLARLVENRVQNNMQEGSIIEDRGDGKLRISDNENDLARHSQHMKWGSTVSIDIVEQDSVNNSHVIYSRFQHSTRVFEVVSTKISDLPTEHREYALQNFADNIIIVGMKSLLYSIGFLNCSNVGTVIVKNNSKSNKKFKKKHGREPLEYREIVVEPRIGQVSKHSNDIVDHRDLPLHVVRGHFRKYTEDRPLFGKYSGTFWIPAHAKGSKDHGEIVHEYEVNPEEEL